MPPKRKSATTSKAIAKKVKNPPTETDNLPALVKVVSALKKSSSFRKKVYSVDRHLSNCNNFTVVNDYDCMLNQTNIGNNNNKFYVIQLLKGIAYHTFNRWGRVGESGANSLKTFSTLEAAETDFKKKFLDKTGNRWEDRANFVIKKSKYTLLEMGDDAAVGTSDAGMIKVDNDGIQKVVKSCSLDSDTQDLIKLIFDQDMFKEAMVDLKIDVKKMPLGKLSKVQIIKGFEILSKLQEELNKKVPNKGHLMEITSQFYTVIPHDFGRQRPPVIETAELLQSKLDLLAVLGDIEIAQSLQNNTNAESDQLSELPHPLDVNYKVLSCDLTLLKKSDADMQLIERYLNATQGHYSLKLLAAWRVSRHGEQDRFKLHDNLVERKLLWHGTNVAVVAAILKSGLRIMPHSGGRVGRGIYFASENAKSASYVRPAGRVGIMFLNEVALGRINEISCDDCSLKKAPDGFDSVVARGQVEPDPSLDTILDIDGHRVTVPQGTPKNQAKWKSSSFFNSEYLVYKESQARIRYLLKLRF